MKHMSPQSFHVLACMGRSAMNEAAEPGQNSPAYTFEDVLREVRKFGRDAAEGQDALPRLAIRFVKAVADGVIDVNSKDDEGRDPAAVVYSEYISEQSKKAVLDHSAAGKKANQSKLRKLGEFATGTTYDPIEVINRTVVNHKTLTEAGEKVLSTYPAFVAVAREQLKNSDQELTDEEIKGAIRKPVAPDKDVRKVLEQAEKLLKNLITGDNKAGLMDQHEETIAAHDAISRRLAALTLAEQRHALMEQAAALGMEFAE